MSLKVSFTLNGKISIKMIIMNTSFYFSIIYNRTEDSQMDFAGSNSNP